MEKKILMEGSEGLRIWHDLPVSNIFKLSGDHAFTLKEDVDVADKALAADVRDNMEPWRLRLVSEP